MCYFPEFYRLPWINDCAKLRVQGLGCEYKNRKTGIMQDLLIIIDLKIIESTKFKFYFYGVKEDC